MYAGKVGAVAKALDAKVANSSLGGGGSAAYKGDGSIKFYSAGTDIGNTDVYRVKLLLLDAGIVDLFNLDTYPFGQTADTVAVYAPRANVA